MIKNNSAIVYARLMAPTICIVLVAAFENLYNNNLYVEQTIIIKSILVTWLGYVVVVSGIERFQHRFYAAMFFTIFIVLYLAIFPALAVVLDAHFVIRDDEIFGYQKVLDMAALSILIFYATYCAVLEKNKKHVTLMAGTNTTSTVIACALILLFVGTIAMLWLTAFVSAMDVQTYDDVSLVFTGKGWLLRLSELTAVAGILLICASGRHTKRYFYLGIICVVMFSLFRLQFLNRENVIKYYFVVVIYLLYVRGATINKNQVQALFIVIFSLLALIPNLSIMRAALNKKSFSIDYAYTFSRDLNFSEVAAVLYANDEFRGAMGLSEGWRRTYTQMIPRDMMDNKPFVVSIVITARTTTVASYDELNPTFAYAATFLGVYYYISGSWLAMLYVALLALISAKLSDWVDGGKTVADVRTRKAFMAVFIYHVVISTIKLDPGNAYPAAIIPCLAAYVPCLNINRRK